MSTGGLLWWGGRRLTFERCNSDNDLVCRVAEFKILIRGATGRYRAELFLGPWPLLHVYSGPDAQKALDTLRNQALAIRDVLPVLEPTPPLEPTPAEAPAQIQIAVGDATVIVDVYETDTDETLDARVARAVGGAGRALGLSLAHKVRDLADDLDRRAATTRARELDLPPGSPARDASVCARAEAYGHVAVLLRELIET